MNSQPKINRATQLVSQWQCDAYNRPPVWSPDMMLLVKRVSELSQETITLANAVKAYLDDENHVRTWNDYTNKDGRLGPKAIRSLEIMQRLAVLLNQVLGKDKIP